VNPVQKRRVFAPNPHGLLSVSDADPWPIFRKNEIFSSVFNEGALFSFSRTVVRLYHLIFPKLDNRLLAISVLMGTVMVSSVAAEAKSRHSCLVLEAWRGAIGGEQVDNLRC
jgi:hypothetical protein